MSIYRLLILSMGLILCGSISHTSCFTLKKPQITLYEGVVQYPHSLEQVPLLFMSYKGTPLKIEGEFSRRSLSKRGYYEFYEFDDCKELNILVVEALKIPDNNTIKGLETLPGTPYKLYKLSRYSRPVDLSLVQPPQVSHLLAPKQQLEFVHTWLVNFTYGDGSVALNIPDNTLVFFMDPMIIQGVKVHDWDSSDTIVRLPTILFQDSLEAIDFAEIAARISCGWLDYRFMHCPLGVIESTKNDRKIVLPGSSRLFASRSPLGLQFSYG